MSHSTPQAISVVIPSFNYGHYLSETVGSVLAQTHHELECLVVDDGSTDNTADLVQRMTDPRVRYVPKQNGGLSSARNRGVREAKHDYVAFLDADDRWLPGFLERIVAEFARLPDRFGAVASASFLVDEHGHRFDDWRFTFGPTGELTFRDFCLRNKPLSSSIVIRKDCLLECGNFDESLRSSEDRDYWLRLTAKGWKVQFLDEPLAEIRRHSNNMSRVAARMEANRSKVLSNARRAGVISPKSPFWLKVYSAHLLHTARAFHSQGSTARALGLLTLSCLAWPWVSRPAEFSERSFFRLRAFARFIIDRFRRSSR